VQGPVTFLHTRTIVNPQYGVKLTGKIGKTALGLMLADDEAPGTVEDALDPVYKKSAGVLVGRLRYDLYPESSIGALFTDRELVNSHSRLGGVDGTFRFARIYRVAFAAMFSDRLELDNTRLTGPSVNVDFDAQGRNLNYSFGHNWIHPEFGTDLGFVRRTDQKETTARVQYRWYPETWIVNWAPRLEYQRLYDYEDVRQNEGITTGVNFQFARNMNMNANVTRDMERYNGVEFHKTRVSFFGQVNAIRTFSIGGGFNDGDQIRFIDDPYLGKNRVFNMFMNIRPIPRLQVQLNVNRSRFTDIRTDTQVFDIKIFRAQTTYQITDRWTFRNILEHNTYDRTLGANLLGTYRVNSGTAFYVGYDDRYREGFKLDETLYPTTALKRTNRAIFAKIQYLFRL
jgi:hypothetical protein